MFTAVKRLGTRVNTRVIYVLPVTFPLHPTKFPRSTSATRAISVLSSIILPLQTFFSRVLLLRQQPFWSENPPLERPTTTIAIKTQVVMFRFELVNSTRKFTIVAQIVSLLKKRYRDFRAVFKVKTLAVLLSPYPRKMTHIPQNLHLPPFWRLLVSIDWNGAIHSHARSPKGSTVFIVLQSVFIVHCSLSQTTLLPLWSAMIVVVSGRLFTWLMSSAKVSH